MNILVRVQSVLTCRKPRKRWLRSIAIPTACTVLTQHHAPHLQLGLPSASPSPPSGVGIFQMSTGQGKTLKCRLRSPFAVETIWLDGTPDISFAISRFHRSQSPQFCRRSTLEGNQDALCSTLTTVAGTHDEYTSVDVNHAGNGPIAGLHDSHSGGKVATQNVCFPDNKDTICERLASCRLQDERWFRNADGMNISATPRSLVTNISPRIQWSNLQIREACASLRYRR